MSQGPLNPRSLLDRLAQAVLDDSELADALLTEEGLDLREVRSQGEAFISQLLSDEAETISPEEQVAQEFNWTDSESYLRRVRELESGSIAYKGYFHDQPVALFVTGDGDINELISEAAPRAYQASIPWGIVRTPGEVGIFNSLWLTGDDWYRVTSNDWNPANSVVESFTPKGVTEGELETRVRQIRQREDDAVLVPIDDRLVDQLDLWRREALRQAEDRDQADAWDAAIQGLFAKLFILRTVEDSLDEDLPPVSQTVSADGLVDIDALREHFRHAKEVIESDLFDDVRYETLPPLVVGRIIQGLYTPEGFRVSGFRYDFSWVESDVLGQAYEQYLSRVLSPSKEEGYGDLFGVKRAQLSEVSVRKDHGVYYTPNYLVRHLSRQAIEAYDRGETSGNGTEGIPRIADFSCGSGSFLRSAVDLLLNKLNEERPGVNWGKYIVENQLVVGVDTDVRAVEIARLNVYQRLIQESQPLPLPRLRECIVQGDALTPAVWETLPRKYGVVLGNPPFLSTLRQQYSRSALRERFETARGRFDTAFLFVELALSKLDEGGVLAMVVPNRVFGNRDAAALRGVVTRDACLMSIEDFGSLEVFAQTNAYVGTVIAQRCVDKREKSPFRFIQVQGLPAEGSEADLGVELDQAAASDRPFDGRYVSAFTVVNQPRGGDAWRFPSPHDRRVRQIYEDASIPLPDICDTPQGIKTGANDVFVVTLTGGAFPIDSVVQVMNGFGERHEVDTASLKLLTYGGEIERYSHIEPVGPYVPSRLLVYPYLKGERMSEAQLRDVYPLTFDYLTSQQDVLGARRCVTSQSKEWFELERHRSEGWLDAPKLMMRDLAQRPSFAINDDGGVYLVGGTAVVPENPALLLPLLGFLNSALANWYLESITPGFRSGYRKVEPQHLRSLRVPSFIVNDSSDREELADLVADRLELGPDSSVESDGSLKAERLEQQIDEMIFRLTGVGLSGE